MLSRIADSLFWMARYMERAEDTARILDVNYDMMLEGAHQPYRLRWEPLVIISGAHERFFTQHDEAAPRSVFEFLGFSEDNPDSIAIIRRKAEAGLDIRIMMADPDSPECIKRGIEERLFDAIPARVRMALAYYAPLAGIPGIEFRLQAETLYNSIFAYDDEMLINQHVYGMYGYMAPILHLRRMEGGDFFDMYVSSFERVWEVSSPIEGSGFWKQRAAAINSARELSTQGR